MAARADGRFDNSIAHIESSTDHPSHGSTRPAREHAARPCDASVRQAPGPVRAEKPGASDPRAPIRAGGRVGSNPTGGPTGRSMIPHAMPGNRPGRHGESLNHTTPPSGDMIDRLSGRHVPAPKAQGGRPLPTEGRMGATPIRDARWERRQRHPLPPHGMEREGGTMAGISSTGGSSCPAMARQRPPTSFVTVRHHRAHARRTAPPPLLLTGRARGDRHDGKPLPGHDPSPPFSRPAAPRCPNRAAPPSSPSG